ARDQELVENTVAFAARHCELNPRVRSFSAAAAHARALAQKSVVDLERAVSLFDDGLRPLASASALEDLGSARLSRGERKEAITAFDRALAINTGVGATWDAARVRGRLRNLGVRRRLASSDHAGTGWEALSPAELRVVRVAVVGKTNPDTPQTVFTPPHNS